MKGKIVKNENGEYRVMVKKDVKLDWEYLTEGDLVSYDHTVEWGVRPLEYDDFKEAKQALNEYLAENDWKDVDENGDEIDE